MDDIGELMVVVGLVLIACGDAEKVWPYSLALVVIGAALYFIDRIVNRKR